MSGGFQQQVYAQPAPAVAGDFASQNPYYTFDAGPGGLVSGDDGLYTGRFAWVYPPTDPNGTAQIASNVSNGAQIAGFVLNSLQADITGFLDFASQRIIPGKQVTLMTGGDFWVINDGSTIATPGMKAFAINANGKARFEAAGTVVGGASATSSSVAAATESATGSINGTVMTLTVVGGTIYLGSTVSGTGVVGAPKIISQISGTAGDVGTYQLDVLQPDAVASTSLTMSYGDLTIGTATGTFEIGDILTGTGVVAGTTITANISGSGGTGGHMVVNNNTVVSSATITASDAVETKWYARSSGANGELVKISSQPLG